MMSRRSILNYIASIFTFSFLLSFFGFKNKKAVAYAPEIILFNRQKITPPTPIQDDHAKPSIVPSTNNLRRKTGSPFLAKGEYLGIKGHVTDLVSVPIENASIKIWQTNHFGYYNYLAEQGDLNQFDIDFLSAGECKTDNHGSFFFTTIMPGWYGTRAPHIHMLITHEHFDKLETEIFFPDHPRNKEDKKYQMLNSREKTLLTCFLQDVNVENPKSGKIATFNVRLDGLHRTKRF